MDFTTKFGKITDGVLEVVDSFKVVSSIPSPVRVLKSVEELDGYKVIDHAIKPIHNLYEEIVEHYEEFSDFIRVTYSVERKSDEEVSHLNTEFWEENYFQIQGTEFYVPYTSEAYCKTFDLLKDDLSVIMMGASANHLTHLNVYRAPDMLATFDAAYIDSLKVEVSDKAMLNQILYKLSAMLYEKRTVPTVI